MDPFTIASTVVKITGTCLSTAKALYELRNKYNDAPMTIVTISSEITVISASLSHLQMIICPKQDFVRTLDSRPELAHTLDTALIGCMVIFSCLDEEIRDIIAKRSQTGALSWKGKAKVVWNDAKLREMLDSLRGQQNTINFLIQLVQLDSLEEIKQILVQNRPIIAETLKRTKSLRLSNPEVDVPVSIYSPDDRCSIYSIDSAMARDSMVEFDFDDVIVNSKIYRQVLASARRIATINDQVIEGDLIDLSDSHTITAVAHNHNMEDLKSLVISADDLMAATSTQSRNITNDTSILPANMRKNETVSQPATVLDEEIRKINEVAGPSTSGNMKFGEYILGATWIRKVHYTTKLAQKEQSTVMVAIKIYKRNKGEEFVHLAQHEITVMKELDHPNIVRCYETLTTKKRIGLVFEFFSGGSIYDYVEQHLYLKDPAAQRLFAQLISGVGYLHKKGCIHRNLGLENLILDRNRNLVIHNFEFGRIFDPQVEEERVLDQNDLSYLKFMGVYNIPPEDLVKKRDLTPLKMKRCTSLCCAAPEAMPNPYVTACTSTKTDIWSCGVILYAMLAGFLPFHEQNDPPIFLADQGEHFPSVLLKTMYEATLVFPEYVTPHSRDLLRRILVQDPRKRADVYEIARHSWLSEYAHVVGFITKPAQEKTK